MHSDISPATYQTFTPLENRRCAMSHVFDALIAPTVGQNSGLAHPPSTLWPRGAATLQL